MVAQTRVGTVEEARVSAPTQFEGRTNKFSCEAGGGVWEEKAAKVDPKDLALSPCKSGAASAEKGR